MVRYAPRKAPQECDALAPILASIRAGPPSPRHVRRSRPTPGCLHARVAGSQYPEVSSTRRSGIVIRESQATADNIRWLHRKVLIPGTSFPDRSAFGKYEAAGRFVPPTAYFQNGTPTPSANHPSLEMLYPETSAFLPDRRCGFSQ